MLGQIRWLWVLAGGFLAEVALLLFVPIQFLPGGQTILLWLVIPICLLIPGLAGAWVARKAGRAPLVHGALVGLVALLLYVALTFTQELPLVYHIANYSKVLGGLAGGWLASRTAHGGAGNAPA